MKTTACCHTLIDDLAIQGWAIATSLLPDNVIKQLTETLWEMYQADELNAAKLGQAGLHQTTIRGDLIQWIDVQNSSSGAISHYIDFLSEFQQLLNRELQLGLKEYEIHYTVYPKGRGYQRHIDQFAHKKTRAVSFILYLNDQWQISDGGLLTLFDKDSLKTLIEIKPEANTFACFLSDIPHEISITQRERLSVTGWFKRY